MPIDKSKYHPKWSLISRLIRLRRAGGHCEQCGVRNYSVGRWQAGIWQPDPAGSDFDSYKVAAAYRDYSNRLQPKNNRLSVIILTCAHLDHDPKNNRFANLKALCQRCHFCYDRKDNARRRKYGRADQTPLILFPNP